MRDPSRSIAEYISTMAVLSLQTVSVMTTFFLLMMLYPHTQARAQEEIDRVIGKSRLPNVGDRNDLPYVDALLKEILRWAPAAPLALPHRLIQDDTYNGFRIPKDTIVLPNIWFVCAIKMIFQSSFSDVGPSCTMRRFI